jgi:hypothetical protein
MVSHYDWKNGQQTCPECGWIGLGNQTEMGESFDDGADYHCPTCDHRFGYIAYPTIDESRSDPRAPATDKMFGDIVAGRVQRQTDK